MARCMNTDRDLAHEADMRELAREQLRADVSAEDADEELADDGYDDEDYIVWRQARKARQLW